MRMFAHRQRIGVASLGFVGGLAVIVKGSIAACAIRQFERVVDGYERLAIGWYVRGTSVIVGRFVNRRDFARHNGGV